MTKHYSIKRKKRETILLVSALCGVAGVLATVYLYKPLARPAAHTRTVSTSTPVVSELAALGLTLSIIPEIVEQGEPVLLVAEGVASTSSVESFTIDNRPLVTFIYDGKVSALLGVDLSAKPGALPLVLTLKDGRQARSVLVVRERPLIEKPFGIPEKLGGNTPEAQKELISTLIEEARIINALPTTMEKLWDEDFGSPLSGSLVVSDSFGHIRITGSSLLRHRGVDLIAPIGTSVYAMNRGVVRYAGYLRNYGNAVVIDHGLGLQILYMHLSEISVLNAQAVVKGDILGRSGDTGYVLDPHLHISVRIWDVSVDPLKFLKLLGLED